jgi:hypothetical protein
MPDVELPIRRELCTLELNPSHATPRLSRSPCPAVRRTANGRRRLNPRIFLRLAHSGPDKALHDPTTSLLTVRQPKWAHLFPEDHGSTGARRRMPVERGASVSPCGEPRAASVGCGRMRGSVTPLSAEAFAIDGVTTRPHEPNSSINTLACFRSCVSNPSANQS